MMDLPLMMTAPPAGGGGATPVPATSSDPAAFAATLTSLLGDAGREVVEMVEALELLTELDHDQEQLTASGWPLAALLAMRGQGDPDLAGAITDPVPVSDSEPAEQVAGTEPPHGEADLDLHELGDLLAALVKAGEETTLPADVEANVEAASGAAQVDGGADGGGEVEGDAVDDTAGSQMPQPAGAGPGEARTGQELPDADVEVGEADALLRAGRIRAAGRTDETVQGVEARTRGAAEAGSSTTARSEVPIDRVPTGGEPIDLSPRAEAARPSQAPVLSSAVARVLEAVQQLETMPPPRQLTIDLGEVRVRVAMEDGQVRLTILEGDAESADDLLQDARDELTQRGFDLGADGDERPGSDARSGDDAVPTPAQPRRSSPRIPAGLRL